MRSMHPAWTRETVYREGRQHFTFWTYSDGARIVISLRMAQRMIDQGAALIICD